MLETYTRKHKTESLSPEKLYQNAVSTVGWKRAVFSMFGQSKFYPKGMKEYKWNRCMAYYYNNVVNFPENKSVCVASLINYIAIQVELEPNAVNEKILEAMKSVKVSPTGVPELELSPKENIAKVGSVRLKVPRDFKVRVKSDDKQLALLVLRYYPLGVDTGMFWSVDPGLMLECQKLFRPDTVLECFASPFNYTLDNFCSAFNEDMDLLYRDGTKCHGDFFEYIEELSRPHTLFVNPPYTNELIDKTAQSLDSYFKRCEGQGAMIVTLPDWKLDGITLLKSMEGSVSQVLEYGDFVLYDAISDRLIKPKDKTILIIVNWQSNTDESQKVLEGIVEHLEDKASNVA